MNAAVFLYKKVLKQLPLNDEINAVLAAIKSNVLVVLTRQEVASVLALVEGTQQLVAKVRYKCGNRSPIAQLATEVSPFFCGRILDNANAKNMHYLTMYMTERHKTRFFVSPSCRKFSYKSVE